MNRYLAASVLAIAAAATSTAFAEGPIEYSKPFVSAQSRAQVGAELQQYQQSGVNPWAQDYDQLAGFRSGKTAAQVRAEFLQSRDEAAAMTREDSGSSYLSARGRSGSVPVLAGRPANAQ
jgi:hypothetical protein